MEGGVDYRWGGGVCRHLRNSAGSIPVGNAIDVATVSVHNNTPQICGTAPQACVRDLPRHPDHIDPQLHRTSFTLQVLPLHAVPLLGRCGSGSSAAAAAT